MQQIVYDELASLLNEEEERIAFPTSVQIATKDVVVPRFDLHIDITPGTRIITMLCEPEVDLFYGSAKKIAAGKNTVDIHKDSDALCETMALLRQNRDDFRKVMAIYNLQTDKKRLADAVLDSNDGIIVATVIGSRYSGRSFATGYPKEFVADLELCRIAAAMDQLSFWIFKVLQEQEDVLEEDE